ncbi:two-component system chemotaxis response regulator CheB [Geothermobacter ehrlichii]|uniref:Protein-glutamate methylesterase/protein-glutamine glutaminase n=2 Tax=Geothermobacter ehrlichii TaxID=213224 RepID=A0A5D3WMY0_9BACT|nr:two-component system chemotaxis response regulator CheB [Geothermobacter ehrlichii]
MTKRVRVLVVDDSALVRQAISHGLNQDPSIEVVGQAVDAFMARDLIVRLRPDVVTLDVEMPRMNGVEFLRRLMPQYPLPVIMVSSQTRAGCRVTIEALEAGAVDFVTKPSGMGIGLEQMLVELREKVKIAAAVDVSHWRKRRDVLPRIVKRKPMTLNRTGDLLVAIGASTGGTEATRKILSQLPEGFPGIVITQHMPPGFTSMYAESLDRSCPLKVREAHNGDRVAPGQVLLAPGGKHMRVVRRNGGGWEVVCREGELVSGHCPSVDVLFESVARAARAKAIGVILTGMGQDGADGLLAMARAGARTIGQDRQSCVVYGMPKVAHEKGAVQKLVPLANIPEVLVRLVAEGDHG